MAFPTAELVEAWNSGEAGSGSVGELMAWAEFSDDLRAGVLVAIGIDHDVHYRRLTLTTDSEINDVVAETRVGEGRRPCNLGEKGQIRLFFNGLKPPGGDSSPSFATHSASSACDHFSRSRTVSFKRKRRGAERYSNDSGKQSGSAHHGDRGT